MFLVIQEVASRGVGVHNLTKWEVVGEEKEEGKTWQLQPRSQYCEEECRRGKTTVKGEGNKAKEWVEVFIQISRRQQSKREAPQP